MRNEPDNDTTQFEEATEATQIQEVITLSDEEKTVILPKL
jgi:hypothetical protein